MGVHKLAARRLMEAIELERTKVGEVAEVSPRRRLCVLVCSVSEFAEWVHHSLREQKAQSGLESEQRFLRSYKPKLCLQTVSGQY